MAARRKEDTRTALIHAYTHARHSYTRTFTERERDGVHASACMQCVNEPACQCVPVRETDRDRETERQRDRERGERGSACVSC